MKNILLLGFVTVAFISCTRPIQETIVLDKVLKDTLIEQDLEYLIAEIEQTEIIEIEKMRSGITKFDGGYDLNYDNLVSIAEFMAILTGYNNYGNDICEGDYAMMDL